MDDDDDVIIHEHARTYLNKRSVQVNQPDVIWQDDVPFGGEKRGRYSNYVRRGSQKELFRTVHRQRQQGNDGEDILQWVLEENDREDPQREAVLAALLDALDHNYKV
jgi:hypothetical protein